ncbi:MAG TPA: hypothetical protein VFV38_26165 [Ktedonobacteraceae bacterium]|nr:hypothetical protein [Ktedonobacteraceae bacterium]
MRKRIYELLIEQKATALVSSAACGADLLALDVAGELGIRRRVILPFGTERFRALSVIDRPGEWGTLFDRIISEVCQKKDLIFLHERKTDKTKFIYTNTCIFDEALSLARSTAQRNSTIISDRIIAVIVWEGKSHGEDDMTVDFAQEAIARSIPITEIATS